MVSCAKVALAVAAALATAASANTYDYECYADGERAIGAPGYVAVDYLPCCSGKPPLPMDDKAYGYDSDMSWGLFCGGTGKVVVTEKCYKDGERAIGAKGYPAVDYMPCCNGMEPKEVAYDWGKFCGGEKPVEKEPAAIRCAGADGYPYVEYVDCGYGYKCAPDAKYGWGSFCLPVTKADCYAPGERAVGADGYPAIPYLPCCNGMKPMPVDYNWGKFCPGDYKGPAVTAAPKTYYPAEPVKKEPVKKEPVYPKAPVAPVAPVAPKCQQAGEPCCVPPCLLDSFKCCDDYECVTDFNDVYTCKKVVPVMETPEYY